MIETMTERDRDIHRGEPADAEIIETTAMQPAPQNALAPAGFFGDDPEKTIGKITSVANILRDVLRKQGLIVSIQGREYPKCEAWTLAGSMLGIFPVCRWTKTIDGGFEARVEAVTLSGSIVGAAEAQCTRSERTWAQRDDYALKSMAQTRATAKALRMPLGFVMTLAGYEVTPSEEMPTGAAPQTVDVRSIALGEKPAPSNVYTEHAGTQQNASQSKGAAPAPSSAGNAPTGAKPPANLTCPKCGERKCGRSQYAPDDGDHPANPDGSPNYCYRRFYCYACKGKFPTDDPELCDQEAGIGNEGPVNQAPPTDKAVVDKHEAAINLTTSLDNLTTFWELVNADWRQGKLTRKGMDHLKEVAAERKRWLANQPPADADGNCPY